jgi:hypothetical protein
MGEGDLTPVPGTLMGEGDPTPALGTPSDEGGLAPTSEANSGTLVGPIGLARELGGGNSGHHRAARPQHGLAEVNFRVPPARDGIER